MRETKQVYRSKTLLPDDGNVTCVIRQLLDYVHPEKNALFGMCVHRHSENSEHHAGHLVLHCWNITGLNENQPDQN